MVQIMYSLEVLSLELKMLQFNSLFQDQITQLDKLVFQDNKTQQLKYISMETITFYKD